MATWKGRNLNNCQKAELINIIMDEIGTNDTLQSEITELKSVVHVLQEQTAELLAKMDTLLKRPQERTLGDLSDGPADATVHGSGRSNSPMNFASVVKSSVQSVFMEEKAKSDVVIINLPEKGQDAADMSHLCEVTGVITKPITAKRLGKKNENNGRHRLLMATFPTPFDARTFQLKVNEAKHSKSLTIPNIRCRPGRTKKEQENRTKLSDEIYKLNQEARKDGNESYSIRQNGQVWKFQKNDEGQWRRVADWKYTPKPTGNER